MRLAFKEEYQIDEEKRNKKMRSDDRILVLRPIEGVKIKSTTGLIDPRIFQGDNKLHAIRSDIDNLWHLKYDSGILPGYLKQSFTSFKQLYNSVKPYFERRGIQITEIID